MSCDEAADQAWIEERIAKTKELIIAYEDALLALGTGGVQSYSLNTGQTQQMVTKANVASMKNMLAVLEARLASYQARLCGGAVTHVLPDF